MEGGDFKMITVKSRNERNGFSYRYVPKSQNILIFRNILIIL